MPIALLFRRPVSRPNVLLPLWIGITTVTWVYSLPGGSTVKEIFSIGVTVSVTAYSFNSADLIIDLQCPAVSSSSLQSC